MKSSDHISKQRQRPAAAPLTHTHTHTGEPHPSLPPAASQTDRQLVKYIINQIKLSLPDCEADADMLSPCLLLRV